MGITMLEAITNIAAGFSVFAGLVYLVKIWHQPRFVTGILPSHKCNISDLAVQFGQGTAQRTKYKQSLMLQAREFTRDEQSELIIPILMQNQGLGIASSITVNIELNTDKINILDISTEALKVNAVYGNAENISDGLRNVVANTHIRKAYERIGPSGTYIQLIGAFPSKAVEIFALAVNVEKPLTINVTIRAQTPDRIFQQKAVHQKLKVS